MRLLHWITAPPKDVTVHTGGIQALLTTKNIGIALACLVVAGLGITVYRHLPKWAVVLIVIGVGITGGVLIVSPHATGH